MALHNVYFHVKFFYQDSEASLTWPLGLVIGTSKVFPLHRLHTASPSPVIGLFPTPEDVRMTCPDVKRVMEQMGIFGKRDRLEAFYDGIGSNEMAHIFEEEEPYLNEVKEAFYVFDDNCDIDTKELRDVLVKLCVNEFTRVTERSFNS